MQWQRVFTFIVALITSATCYAAPLDIVGIKVGMPANEAIKVLKAHNPQLTFSNLEWTFSELPGQKVLRYIFAEDPNRETFQIEIALPPGSPIVTAVYRHLSIKQGQEPTRENVLASLREKYGREAFKTWPEVYFWHFDSAGRLVPKNDVCHQEFNPLDARFRAGQQLSAQHIALLQQRAQKCGSVVGVSLHAAANPQLVRGISMLVSDEQLTADRHKATSELLLRSAEQAKNQQIKDAGKRARPKL